MARTCYCVSVSGKLSSFSELAVALVGPIIGRVASGWLVERGFPVRLQDCRCLLGYVAVCSLVPQASSKQSLVLGVSPPGLSIIASESCYSWMCVCVCVAPYFNRTFGGIASVRLRCVFRVRLNEVGFPAEAHCSTVGLRWGLLRRVHYGAVDAGKYC